MFRSIYLPHAALLKGLSATSASIAHRHCIMAVPSIKKSLIPYMGNSSTKTSKVPLKLQSNIYFKYIFQILQNSEFYKIVPIYPNPKYLKALYSKSQRIEDWFCQLIKMQKVIKDPLSIFS